MSDGSAVKQAPSGAKRAVQVTITFAIWVGALFWGAGRVDWLRGWISAVLWICGMLLLGALVKRFNPGLMEARAKFNKADTKPFDRIFLAFFVPISLLQPAVAGLDVVRFHWSSMAFWTLPVGVVLYVAGNALVTWVMCVNPHAEGSVRIQNDRGHQVISSGPYKFVRHPMYAGSIVMYLGTALVWGSKWALALAVLDAVLFAWRTAMEDATLRKELAGYEDFAQQTKYRLAPGIW